MVDLHQGRVTLKRGGFAKDQRTGQVVKVAEVGGRDYMVRPAYKSDGYWVAPEHLVPARDPHTWGVRHLLTALVVLAVAAWFAYGVFNDLTGHGISADHAFWQGALPTGVVLTVCLGNLFGLNRS